MFSEQLHQGQPRVRDTQRWLLDNIYSKIRPNPNHLPTPSAHSYKCTNTHTDTRMPNKQKQRITTHLDHSLGWLMNPQEALASVYELRGSSPCLFSISPMSLQHLLIELIILCLFCDRPHAWQVNPTCAGHSWCNLIESDGWPSRPVCMIHISALFSNMMTSLANASTLIWGDR